MAAELPLPALLSAALVAFTIEADNEAERLTPHTTTSHGATGERGSVWLTSLAMWFNCVRELAQAGPLTVAELERRARMSTNLDGMRRWGYLTIDGVGRVRRGASRPTARQGSVLALTDRGRTAGEIWQPLPGVIEARWRERFGGDAIDRLRSALAAVAGQIEAALPDYMPIAGPGRNARPEQVRDQHQRQADADLPLVSLLARVLIQFGLDYERNLRPPLSLPLWSNLLRVLDVETATAVRDLPRLTGVSKEGLAMLTGALERAGWVIVEPAAPPGRGRHARLTPDRGARARAAGSRQIQAASGEWEEHYGADAVGAITAALVPIVGDGARAGSPLFVGLDPPPGCWRAQVPPPELLPWYPMVLHRGGFPDGS